MKLEAYGWASWTPKKGLLTLRNPSDKPQAFSVDLQRIFELPKGAATNYSLHSPWKEDKGKPSMDLKAGESKVVILKPFEVLVLEAKPQ